MKEFMPDTHVGTELIRGYAQGFVVNYNDETVEVQLNFDDIAADRGPRLESTLDMYPAQIPPYAWGPETWTRKREIEPYERKLAKGEKDALRKASEDSIEFERQLVAQNRGTHDDNDPGAEHYMFFDGTIDTGYAGRRSTRT